ncbi:MAG: hypothetical protein ACK4VI_09020 [Alphaproteobacteria bacterium]
MKHKSGVFLFAAITVALFMIATSAAEAQNLYLRDNPNTGTQRDSGQQSGAGGLFLPPQSQPTRNRNTGAGAPLFSQQHTPQRQRQSFASRQQPQQQHNMIDEYQRLNIENAQRFAEDQLSYANNMMSDLDRERDAYYANLEAQYAARQGSDNRRAVATQQVQRDPSRQRVQQPRQGSGLQTPPRIFNILD